MTRFRRLATASALTTLALVAVGGLVRATGSGLGCLDDWPTCRGGWIAPLEFHAVIEYSHRALAGVVVVLLVVQAIAARRWVPGEINLRRWSDLAVVAVFAQALLGRVVVTSELHAALVTGHLVLAMGVLAITSLVATRTYVAGRPRAVGDERRVGAMATGAVAGTAILLIAGAYVREFGAGLAFSGWPLMNGTVLPSLPDLDAVVHFVHRVLALLVFGHVLALMLQARRDARPAVRRLAVAAFAVFVAQVFAGAANIWTSLAPAAVMAHVVLGAATWAVLVVLAVVARRGLPSGQPVPETTRMQVAGPAAHHADKLGARTVSDPAPVVRMSSVRAYVQLMKPRIIVLLLVTTVPAMVLAARSFPPLWLVAATLLGGTLTAGSANAINQYLERDIDKRMRRTERRPLPTDSVPPGRALAFGVGVGVLGTAWLAVVVNPLAAALAAAANAFYVVVYTILLKRSTPQNIVIGGAAGAAPVLVGWAAVTGTVGLAAWVMFAIIFVWTPPHFWALAMKYRDDYEAAGIPMLPVVRTPEQTATQILVYSVLLAAVTLVLYPVAGLSLLYLGAASALGAVFVFMAARLRRTPTPTEAMRLFKYSVNYLALLFAVIAVDGVIG